MSGSNDQMDMLLDQLGRLCADHVDRDVLADAERGKRPDTLLDAIEQFGLLDALTIPAPEGGVPFDAAASVFALLGAYAIPLPVGETMIARCVLARAGLAIPNGLVGLVDLDRTPTSLSHGEMTSYVVAALGERLCLFATQGVTKQRVGSISREARLAIDLSQTQPVAETDWPSDLPNALTLGAMLRASQIAGGLGRALAMSVDFARTREQFGRPIGRFQAVQQLLAKLAAEAAAARSAADGAWFALENGRLGWAAAVAKITAGDAARTGAAIAHQVHGAIGFTDEYMLHYQTRRLWEWRLDFGSDVFWAERLGRAARGHSAGIWNFIVAGEPATQPTEAIA